MAIRVPVTCPSFIRAFLWVRQLLRRVVDSVRLRRLSASTEIIQPYWTSPLSLEPARCQNFAWPLANLWRLIDLDMRDKSP